MSEAVAICMQGLTKVYGRRRRKRIVAVDHVSLEIAAGQVYGFLGPNGAGKSTTIRMLLDLILPTAGAAYIFGQHVRRDHGVLRRVGAIVEGASFYNFLSGRRNLEVLARTANHYDPQRIEALLEQVGLADRAGQRVRAYSTGMRQRLGLAAALLTDPDLLILDEPTNGLDPGGMHEIRQFIRQLVDQQGKTVFLSSHLLAEVEQVCDRVAIIDQGRIVREGAVSELLGGKHTVRIEAQPLEQAAAILGAHWRVTLNGHYLTAEAPREAVPEIIRLLVERHIRVYHAASQRQSLEEYFLAAVQERPADA